MTAKSDTPLERNPDHDQHAAAIYRAMALRFHFRYVDMRRNADFRGGDLQGHEPLRTELDAHENYKAAVEECLWEDPDSADAVLAFVEFAGVIAVDRLVGEVLRSPFAADERDAFHQAVALAAVGGWLNEHAMSEWVGKRRAAYGPTLQAGGAA